MYRIRKFAIALLCLLSACGKLDGSNLQYLILSKWVGESSSGTGLQYELKFLPFNILLADIKTPDDEAHNILFSYRFVNQNRITIEGRFSEELYITKKDSDRITIKSVHGFIPDGEYERGSIINLYFLSIFLLMLFLLAIRRYLKNRKFKSRNEVSKVK